MFVAEAVLAPIRGHEVDISDDDLTSALEAAGWIVLRFNWNDVMKRPTSVVRTVERALRVAA